MRESSGLTVPTLGGHQITAKLRDRTYPVERVRAAAFVRDRVGDSETLRVQVRSRRMTTAVAQNRSLPSKDIRKRIRRSDGKKQPKGMVAGVDCLIRVGATPPR